MSDGRNMMKLTFRENSLRPERVIWKYDGEKMVSKLRCLQRAIDKMNVCVEGKKKCVLLPKESAALRLLVLS